MTLRSTTKRALDTLKMVFKKVMEHPFTIKITNIAKSINRRNFIRTLKIIDNKLLLRKKLHKFTYIFNKLIRRIQNTAWYQKCAQYVILVRLNKPIGIFLLLWPTLIALWIAAKGYPDLDIFLIFIFGVILMRSAGCAINDYADRHIDDKVDRTKNRPLAAGTLTEKEALVIFSILSLTAFFLVLLLNELTIYLSFVGLFLAVSYPFMKRYHYLPQIHLGAAFGWTVPMAFTAQANEISPIAGLLFFATILWTTAYDTMYAMADREDDIKIGVKSTAILFGNSDKLIIASIQCLLLFALILIGTRAELGTYYYIGVFLAACLAAYQQYLIKDRIPELCIKAFLNNNVFGFILFVGVFIDYRLST